MPQIAPRPGPLCIHLELDPDGQQAIADEVHQYYQGNFYLADDFDQFTLDATGQLSKVNPK